MRGLQLPAVFLCNNSLRYSAELLCHSLAKIMMLGRMAQHAAKSSDSSQVNAAARVVVEASK